MKPARIFLNYVIRNGQIDGLDTYRMHKAQEASYQRLRVIQQREVSKHEANNPRR